MRNIARVLGSSASVCVLCLLLQGPARAGIGDVELEAFAGYDSNPSRAQAGNRVAAEDIQGAGVTIFRNVALDERSAMVVRGAGTILRHSVFSGLNNLALHANLDYRVQPVVGYTLPWYGVSVDLERRQHANSPIRDAASAALELSAGKHFTDRIDATIGIGVKRSLALRTNVFDLTERRLFATLGYRFGLQNTFYASLSRTRGDQVFGAGESYPMRSAVKASGDDRVFGEGYYAYRIDATSTIAEAGVSVPVRGYGAWGISVKRSRTYAYSGAAYDYTLTLLSWRYRFY